MYFEINVSLHGKHMFATSERSLVAAFDCQKLLVLFRLKFPREEGYEVSATMYETVGRAFE